MKQVKKKALRTEEEKAIVKSYNTGMPKVLNMGIGSKPGSLPTLDKKGTSSECP